MKTTDITVITQEDSKPVIVGEDKKFTAEDKKRFKNATKIIDTASKNINRETLRIIATLGIIEKYEWFRIDGYKSIGDYADNHLNLPRNIRSTYLQIARKFMHEIEDNFVLKDEYKNYSISQLAEMSVIKDQDFLKKFTPDITVAKMREMKKAKKSKLLNGGQNKDTKDLSKKISDVFEPVYDKTFNTFEDFYAEEEEVKRIVDTAKKERQEAVIRIVIERTA